MTEFDRSDREEWYRRGYLRGAWDLYRALIPHLSEDARQIAYQWITTDLPDWSGQTRGEPGSDADSTAAPRFRLNELKKPNVRWCRRGVGRN
jgi:hypothetical protein